MQNTLMIASLLSGLIFTVAGVVTFVALRNAQEGYQDENGFHGGPEPVIATPTHLSDSIAGWPNNARPSERAPLAA